MGGGRGAWRGRARCDSHVRPAPRGPGRQVFPLPAPALRVLPVLLALGAAVWAARGRWLALLAPGRCAGRAAGCARAARARLLRSKITAREPGLRCAPFPRPPALPATARAGEPGLSAPGTQAQRLLCGRHGLGCTWGEDAGGPGSRTVGSSIADNRSSQSSPPSFPFSLFISAPFLSLSPPPPALVSGNLSASPSLAFGLS